MWDFTHDRYYLPMFPLSWFEVIIEKRLVQKIAPMAHHGETSMMRWSSPEETESALHSDVYLTHFVLPRPFFLRFLFFYQSDEINNNGDTGQNGKLDNIVVQRSSASRFCAECRPYIRRSRRQPRYAERMPAIVAPSAAGGASVVGAGVAHRLPPPRHPTRRHLCPCPLASSSSSRSRTVVPPPTPQPHRPAVSPAPAPAQHPRRRPAPTVSSLFAVLLALSIAAATTGCGIDWPSCPSSERGGRSNIRTRPTTAFFTFIAIFTYRLPFLFLRFSFIFAFASFSTRGDTNCKKVLHATVMRRVSNGQIFTTIAFAVDQNGIFFTRKKE